MPSMSAAIADLRANWRVRSLITGPLVSHPQGECRVGLNANRQRDGGVQA